MKSRQIFIDWFEANIHRFPQADYDKDRYEEVAQAAWDEAIAYRDATLALSALPEGAPPIPEGWKLVPVVPTEGMVLQGQSLGFFPSSVKRLYENLIAAAPLPQIQGESK